MKRKNLVIVILLPLLLVIIYFNLYNESSTIKGFPVPKNAELEHASKEKKFEEYAWGSASEENGLPLSYLFMIKLWGWSKSEQMGTLTIYEKDGKKVDVISQTDYLFISKSPEES